MRPPSSGKAGIRLKRPMKMLMGPSQMSRVASGLDVREGRPRVFAGCRSRAPDPLWPSRGAGRPRRGRCSRWARRWPSRVRCRPSVARGRCWTPHRTGTGVIPWTATPLCFATRACASSCSRMQPQKISTPLVERDPELPEGRPVGVPPREDDVEVPRQQENDEDPAPRRSVRRCQRRVRFESHAWVRLLVLRAPGSGLAKRRAMGARLRRVSSGAACDGTAADRRRPRSRAG